MEKLYWVSSQIGADAANELDAISRVEKLLDDEKEDFNFVVSGSYKDEYFETLKELREQNLSW